MEKEQSRKRLRVFFLSCSLAPGGIHEPLRVNGSSGATFIRWSAQFPLVLVSSGRRTTVRVCFYRAAREKPIMDQRRPGRTSRSARVRSHKKNKQTCYAPWKKEGEPGLASPPLRVIPSRAIQSAGDSVSSSRAAQFSFSSSLYSLSSSLITNGRRRRRTTGAILMFTCQIIQSIVYLVRSLRNHCDAIDDVDEKRGEKKAGITRLFRQISKPIASRRRRFGFSVTRLIAVVSLSFSLSVSLYIYLLIRPCLSITKSGFRQVLSRRISSQGSCKRHDPARPRNSLTGREKRNQLQSSSSSRRVYEKDRERGENNKRETLREEDSVIHYIFRTYNIDTLSLEVGQANVEMR